MNFRVLDIEMSNEDNLGFTISGKTETYMRVACVKPLGLAFNAGLKQDDFILTINGIKINSREDIIKSIKLPNKKVSLKIIRYTNLESQNKSNSEFKNSKLTRRSTTDIQSLHHHLLTNLGSKIDMEICRSPIPVKKIMTLENAKLPRRCSSDFTILREDILSNLETKKNNDVSRYHATRRKSLQIIRPSKPIDLKSRKLSDNGPKIMEQSPATPIPVRRNLPNLSETSERPLFASRSWSLRKKTPTLPTLFQNQSLFNISNIDKSVASSPINRDMAYSRTLSMTKTGSVVSLFDEDLLNSMIVDYSIDWKAIFEKISEKTSNEIENELIKYFHNSKVDLNLFPINCLHRFLTFDDVLEIVFNDILTSDFQVDFNQEIMKVPTKIIDVDYDLTSYDVTKLMKCNVKNLEQMVSEYKVRTGNLGVTLEQLKQSLSKYLIRPEYLSKAFREIDNICIKFQRLSDVLILIITTMSTWKLSKDFPHLYATKRCEATIVTTCETIFTEFRDSQKKLEQQIMKLLKQFDEEFYCEVLQLFDQLFSENLEVSICLPIFDDKLRKDNQMLSVLEKVNSIEIEGEQFV